MNKAYEWDYITKPIKFPKPLEETEQSRYFTIEDLQKLFAVIADLEFADFCEFSAYSALRISEIMRLAPSDVDNPEGFLRISEEQKNRTEVRIPINKHMRAIIERCLSRRKGKSTLFQFKKRSWPSQKFKKCVRMESTAKKFTIPIELKVYHLRVCAYFIVSVLEKARRFSDEGSCGGALICFYSALFIPLSIA